jgi:hypothetical protein
MQVCRRHLHKWRGCVTEGRLMQYGEEMLTLVTKERDTLANQVLLY